MPKDKKDAGLPRIPVLRVLKEGLSVNLAVIPVLFFLINIVSVAHGVSQGYSTFVMQKLYDSVAQALGGGSANAVYASVAALGAVFVVRELLNGLHNFMHSIVFDKCGGEITRRKSAKMGRLDPVCLEDTKVQDQIQKAENGASNTIYIINIGITTITFYLPYFIFMGWYLSNVNSKFIFALLFIFVPSMVGQLLRSKVSAKFEDEAAPVRRRYGFYDSTVTSREFFKETRLLGFYVKAIERFLETCRELAKAEMKAAKRNAMIELFTSVLSALGWGGIMYLLVTTLLAGEITVGAFAAVYGSVSLMFGIMREVLSHVGSMAENYGASQNYLRFMDLPERGGTPIKPDNARGIVLEDVRFRYPGAENDSVDGVSLTVNPGETLAVVGANGAGKSTLVRLLIGMYKPTAGRVLLRGADTAQSDESMFAGLSGVFQKYQRYQLTLGENVNVSHTAQSGGEDDALTVAGVEMDGATFPDGLNTMLSREFDGVDLSGGQWQRVAIARGLYRAHDVVVLDEPTAAIDPIEESRIYRQFMDISRGKTAIIVTHRLGSVKEADRVVVMDKGKIIAAAPHRELMEECAPYAEMYNAQSQWYEAQEE